MMEQFNATPSRASSPRVMFDEEGYNGLVLCDKYLPREVLIEIFCYVDCKTLLRCQLVCKRWKMLMDKLFWHKKTERTLGKPFPWNDNMPLHVYYLACVKKPYERNLVRNHSGYNFMDYWGNWGCNGQIVESSTDYIYDGCCQGHHEVTDGWDVEILPSGLPYGMPELPQTEEFNDGQMCFATSFKYAHKVQDIVLEDEGIHPYILDNYQPPIVVSEWYGYQTFRDFPYMEPVYGLTVRLFGTDNRLIDKFQFRYEITEEKQKQWLKVSHIFEKYGRGLRRITFEHSVENGSSNSAEYDMKMARAYVSVKIP